MANTWMNSDGLYLKTGTEEAVLSKAGEFRQSGPDHVTEVTIFDMTTLGSATAIIDDATFIPKGARINEVTLITDTVVTGSSSALNVGLTRFDRTTAIDADGLLAAIALTSMDAAGETTTYRVGVSGVGALVGTTLTNAGYICADYDTAVFTAGKVRIRVSYSFPVTNAFV